MTQQLNVLAGQHERSPTAAADLPAPSSSELPFGSPKAQAALNHTGILVQTAASG